MNTKMMWRGLTSAACLVVMASATIDRAAADDDDDRARGVRSSVAALLAGYEKVPTAADFKKIGPSDVVARELMRLADGKGLVLRLRATSSLAHLPTPAVRTFLSRRIHQDALGTRLRGKALLALGAGFQEAVANTIVPFLASREVRLRSDAIRALSAMAAPEIQQLLVRRIAMEPVPHVRTLMEQGAGKIAQNRKKLKASKRPVPRVVKLIEPPPISKAP